MNHGGRYHILQPKLTCCLGFCPSGNVWTPPSSLYYILVLLRGRPIHALLLGNRLIQGRLIEGGALFPMRGTQKSYEFLEWIELHPSRVSQLVNLTHVSPVEVRHAPKMHPERTRKVLNSLSSGRCLFSRPCLRLRTQQPRGESVHRSVVNIVVTSPRDETRRDLILTLNATPRERLTQASRHIRANSPRVLNLPTFATTFL